MGIAKIPWGLTTNDFDNKHLLHFNASVVITNCACSFSLMEHFTALNCTSGFFGRKLLLIYVISKYKSIYACDFANEICSTSVPERIQSS